VPRHGVPRGTRFRGVRGAAYTGAERVCLDESSRPSRAPEPSSRVDAC